MFNVISDSILKTITVMINSYSGLLQIVVFFILMLTFLFALMKCYQSFKALRYCDLANIKPSVLSAPFNRKTPLSVVAASLFVKAKVHYIKEKKKDHSENITIPPDVFIRDAAFQYSERYFEEKYLTPIGLTANLLPPQGFIGTIIGMVVHFLTQQGGVNQQATVSGIATALYTTLIGLIAYTFIEFLKKTFYMLAQKRIDEGLSIVSLIRGEMTQDKMGAEIEA